MIKDCENRDTLLIGSLYGNVKVLEYVGYEVSEHIRNEKGREGEKYKKKNHYWKIKCNICGNIKLMRERNIKDNPKSCGCNRLKGLAEHSKALSDGTAKPVSGKNNGMYKHGESRSKLNHIWKQMKSRCMNPNNNAYVHYGARGITVCDEWTDPETGYINFSTWAKQNGYNEYDNNISLERINVNKGYNPENCMFATSKQQANNTTVNHIVNWDGLIYTVAELCDRFDCKHSKVHNRLHEGKSLEESILAPDWTPGWTGKFERDDHVSKHGEFRQHPENVTAFVFTDYPEISTIDPKLNYFKREKIAEMRGLTPVPQETEEEERLAREAAKKSLVEFLNNQ